MTENHSPLPDKELEVLKEIVKTTVAYNAEDIALFVLGRERLLQSLNAELVEALEDVLQVLIESRTYKDGVSASSRVTTRRLFAARIKQLLAKCGKGEK